MGRADGVERHEKVVHHDGDAIWRQQKHDEDLEQFDWRWLHFHDFLDQQMMINLLERPSLKGRISGAAVVKKQTL